MSQENEHAALPDRLPIMPMRSAVVYPLGVIGVQIGMLPTLKMLAANPGESILVAQVVVPGAHDDPVDPETMKKVGVAARLSDRLNLPGGGIQATVQGLQRIRLTEIRESNGYYTTAIEPVADLAGDEAETNALIARLLSGLETLAAEIERFSPEVPAILRMNVTDPGRFADLVAALGNFGITVRDEVLQLLDVRQRLQFLAEELERELKRVRKLEEAQEAATGKDQGAPTDQAAEIRRRIQLLQSELGEVDPVEREAVELLRRIDAAGTPPQVAARARLEVERLRSVRPSVIEAGEIRGYIDWLLNMPWSDRSAAVPESLDLDAVQLALDEDLLGLEEPKDRLLDYLAVAKLRGDLCGPIPCIVGPPEVGKSSLVAAVARGLGRPLARLEVGGRGEAHLVGARRTRVGAQPGKLSGALRDVGVRDPLLLLHQMDEVGLGKVEGDPAEALEELLDWRGRESFVDRFLDIPFDLRDVLFIATAQDFHRIPRDLRRLLVEIRIAGYSPEEKVRIAEGRMLPRLIEQHGLQPADIEFPSDALFHLARGYARDAGMGLLRRALATLLRTRARAKASGDTEAWRFDVERIQTILGPPRHIVTAAESAPEVGVVTGLAWTAAGGELMLVEALKMPGSGRLIITGLLGDVMRESVNAAYSYVRSRGEELAVPEEAFRDFDLHVHFPLGAIPKDGPSGGIAVTLAIASSLSNRPVRHDLAMSGEVTLRGKILEVGGIKEKVLAAYRVGLRDVILPEGNRRDLRDVPDDVRGKIRFHFIERMDQAVSLALLDAEATPVLLTSPREHPAGEEPRAARSRGSRRRS